MYTGKGITVAVLDTGMYPHIDYSKRIICFKDFIFDRKYPFDDNGHGTHVTGIIGGDGTASNGKCKGVAPECNLVGIKVLDKSGGGIKENVLRAFEWILNNYERYHIRIINISVGSTYKISSEQDALNRGVEKLWDEGLVVVAAAGNRGPGAGSVTVPGCSKKIITVGSSDMLIGRNATSGRGPTFECVCKPDLVTPGNRIVSCIPYSTETEINIRGMGMQKEGNGYGIKSGTSMSTPRISGAIALALEKDPSLTNIEIKMMLKDSCDDMGLSCNEQGWGCFNLDKFLSL